MLEKLILENQNLIYSIAHYFKNYQSKEDLFQVGCMGLIKAHKNYNPNTDVKFTTYAYSYILGEMKKLVREDNSLKISRDINKIKLKIEKAYVLLTQKLMKEPSIVEISKYLNIPYEIVSDALQSSYVQSFEDVIISNDKDLTLYDIVPDEVNDIDTLILLKNEINNLSKEDKKIINLRYINDMTQSETSKKMGISQVQVSRKEKKVLELIKNKIST